MRRGKGKKEKFVDRWFLELGLNKCLFELEVMRKIDKER